MLRTVAVLSAFVASTAQAGPSGIAVLDIQGTGVSEALLPTLTEILTVEIDNLNMYKVIAGRDVQSMLGFEKQKDMLGCTDAACLAEIGGALGVERIVASHIGKVGSTYVVNIKLINIRMADTEGRVYETVKGEEDALINTVRKSVNKLLGPGSKAAGGMAPAPAPAPAVAAAPRAPAPAPTPTPTPAVAPSPEPAAEPEATEAVSSQPEATVTASAPGKPIPTLSWVGWGVGGLGILGGTMAGLSAKKAEEKANSGDPGSQLEVDKALNRAKFANILWGVGIIGVGVGTVMYVLAEDAPTTALVPVVTPSGAGVALSGAF